MKKGILERLKNDVVLCAEGYLFELERRGYLKAGAFVPEVVLDYPEAVEELHREFLLCGSEIMVAFTYYGHREKMKVAGREGELETLNRNALRIAKKVAAEGDALMAGNLSNTWLYDPADHDGSVKKIRPVFEEQLGWAVDEGADFIIAETFSHVGEALCALEEIKKTDLPAMVTYTPQCETSLDEYQWDDACKILEDNGAHIVGVNCGRGPYSSYHFLQKIRERVSCHVAAQPVPYRTTDLHPYFQDLPDVADNTKRAFPVALDPYVLTRFEMADFAEKARNMGINFIGICCGGAPHHVRAMAEALGRQVPAGRYSPDLSQHPILGDEDKYCND